MNINVISCLIFLLHWLNRSTSCSIFPSLNCSCFQSDFDVNISSPMKIYSHLYCQGNSLKKKTFEPPFGSDFLHQNRFRTISIEFSHQNEMEIHSNQLNSFSLLFSRTPSQIKIEISIRFNQFQKIIFHKHSLTSNIFPEKHQEKSLSLYLLPKATNISGEDHFQFSPNCFSGLMVSEMNIYLHTLREDDFSSSYPFEYIFNHTNIGELHFHDSIIPPGSISLRRTFQGLIRSLTLHRHVDTIDSNRFPYYYSVYSYTIRSIEAHSMDLDSFIPLYKNFRGLELLKPRFEVSINRFIPTLEYLSLDIEDFNDQTLISARHIHHFKLGSRLRRLNLQVLYSLSTRLKTFDLSPIDLSQMTSDSRCYLIHFLTHYHRSIKIIFPRIEYSTECDCARLILLEIQSIQSSNDTSICSKQCRFSDCSVISEYYRDKFPLVGHQSRLIPNDLPSVDLFADPIDVDMMTFLINQTNEVRRSTTTPPPPSLTRVEDVYLMNKEKRFSWLPFSIGVGVALSLILIIGIILFRIAKHKNESHFKALPVYV